MTAVTFLACAITAYGPAMSLLFQVVGQSAELLILMLSSAFLWLLAALLASSLWLAVPSAQLQVNHAIGIAIGVLLQESVRYVYYRVVLSAESGLKLLSTTNNTLQDSPPTTAVGFSATSSTRSRRSDAVRRAGYALAGGLGFGLVSGLIMYVSPLSLSTGPGNLFAPSCPQTSLFYVYAVITCLFTLLHVTWMLLAFESWDADADAPAPRHKLMILYVVLSHFFCAYSTLFNASPIDGGCAVSIVVPACFLLLSGGMCYSQIVMRIQKALV